MYGINCGDGRRIEIFINIRQFRTLEPTLEQSELRSSAEADVSGQPINTIFKSQEFSS